MYYNVADKISTKLFSSFLECEVLVVVSDQYDFEFLIKAAEIAERLPITWQILMAQQTV